MKIVDITIQFRVDENVQEDDVKNWMDDILDLVIDYDSFLDATGYEIEELPEVIGCNSHIELGNQE